MQSDNIESLNEETESQPSKNGWKKRLSVIVTSMIILTGGTVGLVFGLNDNEVNKSGNPLRIGAWNIDHFGTLTMKKDQVPAILKDVIQQYDLMVIQEVKEKIRGNDRNKPTTQLLNKLNSGKKTFNKLMSERVKDEQYAVFYQPSRITVEVSPTHPDSINNFKHPLYKLVLNVIMGDEQYRFGLIVLHASPKTEEMNSLANEARIFLAEEHLAGVLIAGDLNAGPPITSSSEASSISEAELRKMGNNLTHSDFKWLISDDINTSTKSFTYPYDRVIVIGEDLHDRLFNATPYCYDRDVDMPWVGIIPPKTEPFDCEPRSDPFKQKVLDVSDHYPVEVWMDLTPSTLEIISLPEDSGL